MKVRWTSGNLKGLEEEVAQPTGESAIASGIAVRADDGPETEAVRGAPERAVVRRGKAKPKGRAKKAPKKTPKKGSKKS
jgi:hypothetical protein